MVHRSLLRAIATLWLVSFTALGQQNDSSAHLIQLVEADRGVQLEVLDFGGPGRPVVLLPGLGDTAHVFDIFGPKLSGEYHVYAITRRGFGQSSHPDPNVKGAYSADRLGDDVLAVMDYLKLDRPVLIGHSIAGEELSSIGFKHPEKVSGLIYLDAGYAYAFYNASRGDIYLDLYDLESKLELMRPGKGPNDTRPVIDQLLPLLPRFEALLKDERAFLGALPPGMIAGSSSALGPVYQAILTSEQRFTRITPPVLAIFAFPHEMGFTDSAAQSAFDAQEEANTGPQIKAFEQGVPQARVVRLPHANHYVFRSNEDDVLREVRKFLSGLPTP